MDKKALSNENSVSVKRRRLSSKAGMPPGSLVHIGKENTEAVKLSMIKYNAKGFEKIDVKTVEDCKAAYNENEINWINISGIHQTEIINEIGAAFGFHAIVLEDIANSEQRPKFEDYEDYVYVTLKSLNYNKSKHCIQYEQISILFNHSLVVSFQESNETIFSEIVQRLDSGRTKLISHKSDYLVYRLIDTVVDGYFSVIEEEEVEIEMLEDKILKSTGNKILKEIQNIKRDLVILLRSVFPLREAINKLDKQESKFILPETHIYFRDIYDHTIHIIESIETQRDLLSGLMDIYLSSISNRMNSVMKVLTVIATIFIPITFLAGVYGMNFKVLPELQWDYGYLFFWIVCLTATSGMLFYFRKKKWL